MFRLIPILMELCFRVTDGLAVSVNELHLTYHLGNFPSGDCVYLIDFVVLLSIIY